MRNRSVPLIFASCFTVFVSAGAFSSRGSAEEKTPKIFVGGSDSLENEPDPADAPGSEDESVSFSVNQRFGEVGALDPREAPFNDKVAMPTPFAQLKWHDVLAKSYVKEDALWYKQGDLELRLTIQPKLQDALAKSLMTQRNIAGAVVLMESRSGRILAMVEREGAKGNPLNSVNSESIVTSARAPAASLMKIVTATAAMEKVGFKPDEEISFFGGCGHLRRNNWLRDSKQDRQKLTLARAFGLSCNTVFARLAMYSTGLGTLRKYVEGYHFNKPLPSDFRIETSAALLPQAEAATALEVGEAGAGFGASKLSPVHAAMMASVAGNEGKMMVPFLVDSAFDAKGQRVYLGLPQVLAQVASKNVAHEMQILMQDTVLTGTSRKYFRRKGIRADRYEIGGKTGTLSDPEDRSTLYTWFAGIAPLETVENVSIGALVASPKTWVVRASEIAQMSFTHYLRLSRMEASGRGDKALSAKDESRKMGER